MKRIFQEELKELLRDLFPNLDANYFNTLIKKIDEEHKS